jgi:hypothetical protein
VPPGIVRAGVAAKEEPGPGVGVVKPRPGVMTYSAPPVTVGRGVDAAGPAGVVDIAEPSVDEAYAFEGGALEAPPPCAGSAEDGAIEVTLRRPRLSTSQAIVTI